MKDPKIRGFIDEVEYTAKQYEDSIIAAVLDIEDFLERLLTPKSKEKVVVKDPVIVQESFRTTPRPRAFSVLAKQDFKDEIKQEIREEVKVEAKEEIVNEVKPAVKEEIIREIQPEIIHEKIVEDVTYEPVPEPPILKVEEKIEYVQPETKKEQQKAFTQVVRGTKDELFKHFAPQPKIELLVIEQKPKREYWKVIKTFFIGFFSTFGTVFDTTMNAIGKLAIDIGTWIKKTVSNIFHHKRNKKIEGVEFILKNAHIEDRDKIEREFQEEQKNNNWVSFNNVMFPLDEKGAHLLKVIIKKEPENFIQLNNLINIINSAYVLHKKGVTLETLSQIDYTESKRENIFADILIHKELVDKLLKIDKGIDGQG